MDNSLIDSLPAIHGTMASIIVGFYGAYALYAYQTTSSARQKLDDIKRQVQNVSKPGMEGGMDRTGYINSEGELDWKRVERALLDAACLFSHIDDGNRGGMKRKTVIIDDMQKESAGQAVFAYIKKHGFQKDAVYIESTRIEKAGREILGLMGLVMTYYPYLGQGLLHKPERDEITNYRTWIDDLSSRNGFLYHVIWGQHQRSLSELMSQCGEVDIQRDRHEYEESLSKLPKSITNEEKERMIKEYIERPRVDYGSVLSHFFSKIVHIEQHLIPTAKENLITLTTHEKHFKLKSKTLWVLGSAFFVFTCGIMLPMVITTYAKRPFIRSLELTLFVLTMIPYLLGFSYLISVVSRWNHH